MTGDKEKRMIISKRNKEWLESHGFEFEEQEQWYQWKRETGNVVIYLTLSKDNNYGSLSIHVIRARAGTAHDFPSHCVHMKNAHIEKAIEKAFDYSRDRLVDSLLDLASTKKELLN